MIPQALRGTRKRASPHAQRGQSPPYIYRRPFLFPVKLRRYSTSFGHLRPVLMRPPAYMCMRRVSVVWESRSLSHEDDENGDDDEPLR